MGFTLIELLAIIVILAIIAVITVPIILNIIENCKKGAATDSAYGYKDSVNKYYVEKLAENSSYTIPNGIYTVDGTTGYLVGTETLQIQISGQKQNSGAAIARNKGIDESSGDYICFLDSDDYWYKEKIEKQIEFIKDKAFIYSEYLYLNEKTKHIAHVPKSLTYKEALKNTTIFTSTVMLNMKYLKKQDIYMPNIKRDKTQHVGGKY